MNAQQINAKYNELIAAIEARQALEKSKDNDRALSMLKRNEKAIKQALKKFNAETLDNLIKANSSTKKADDAYIAVKAQCRLLKTLYAIGSNMVSSLDDSVATIIANALHNDGTIFAKTALVALSKDIEYNELDQQQIIKVRARKLASTALPQRSSAKESLRFLDLASYNKREKDAAIVMTEKGQEIFKALFA